MKSVVVAYLRSQRGKFHSLLPPKVLRSGIAAIDLSAQNARLQAYAIGDRAGQTELITALIGDRGVGVGGYMERRAWYQKAAHFQAGAEPRNIHLGVDIWAPAGTAISAPLAGRIHSFKDNALYGDYGPTIILEHRPAAGISFFTLYGHLSRQSLSGLVSGAQIEPGELLGHLGSPGENGDWPPHLHFQIILDLQGKSGDFMGVCTESQSALYREICPDPNLILGFSELENADATSICDS